MFRLLLAMVFEMPRVLRRLSEGGVRIVRLLLVELHVSGDPVVLDPEVPPQAEVVAHVAIELAIGGVARIAFLGAPDLLRRIRVAGE
jgi:hypothetical protein